MQQRHNHKRGFNLIEAAIVLGVVGLVIGSIWVGASAVSENHRVNKTVEGVLTTAKNIQKLVSIRDSAQMTDGWYYSHTLVDAGVFPSEWVKDYDVVSPFNKTIQVNNDFGINCFTVYLQDIPKGACARIISKITSLAARTGEIREAGVLGPNQEFWSVFPVTPSQADAACPDNDAVFFSFYYTRTNN